MKLKISEFTLDRIAAVVCGLILVFLQYAFEKFGLQDKGFFWICFGGGILFNSYLYKEGIKKKWFVYGIGSATILQILLMFGLEIRFDQSYGYQYVGAGFGYFFVIYFIVKFFKNLMEPD